jgi:hypothetical protein
MSTIDIFRKLPDDLQRTILSYDGRFKYRNGQWIDQIPKNDYRYNVIASVNRTMVNRDGILFIVLGTECHLTMFWGYSRTNITIDCYYRFVKQKYNMIYVLQ